MSKFDEAVKISLDAAKDYKRAFDDVEDLVTQLSSAVENGTAGAVRVDRRRIGRLPEVVGKMAAQVRDRSNLGVEPEDFSQRWVIEAKSDGGARSLWELSFSPDGYPITITTSDSSEIRCVTREDLEEAIIELLRQGSTGRKIQALQECVPQQAG